MSTRWDGRQKETAIVSTPPPRSHNVSRMLVGVCMEACGGRQTKPMPSARCECARGGPCWNFDVKWRWFLDAKNVGTLTTSLQDWAGDFERSIQKRRLITGRSSFAPFLGDEIVNYIGEDSTNGVASQKTQYHRSSLSRRWVWRKFKWRHSHSFSLYTGKTNLFYPIDVHTCNIFNVSNINNTSSPEIE